MDEPFGAPRCYHPAQPAGGIEDPCVDGSISPSWFVTHDIMEAVSLGDSIAVMDQGRILQQGTIRDVMEHPRNDIVRKLVTTPLEELETFVKDSLQ